MLLWKIAYYLVLLLHYIGTITGILFIVAQLLTPSNILAWIGYFFVAWLAIFLLANGISGGCPFGYLEQYCEVRAGWREKITYTLKDSWAYMYVFSHFEK